MKKTYNFYQDPGHGWVAVPLKDLDELNIRHMISSYSYQKGLTAYLEEDCDASVFVKAYEDKFGTKPVLVSKYQENTPIRSFPDYAVSANFNPEAYREYLYA